MGTRIQSQSDTGISPSIHVSPFSLKKYFWFLSKGERVSAKNQMIISAHPFQVKRAVEVAKKENSSPSA